MIEVQGLTRYYGRHPAVRDLSFRIPGKQVVGLLGLNGAGKSTTLKVLAGLLMPSAGTVRIAGVDATSAPGELRRRIGFLPEEPPLYLEMRVREFLAWCGAIKGMGKDQIEARMPEVLGLCQLEGVADDVIEVLSHGYRKRVGIAQAILHGPDLLLLDEPISGLDPKQIVGMRETIRALGERATVILSSHILSEVEQTCDRILVIDEGRLVAEGTEEDLSSRFGAGVRLLLELRGGRSAVESVLAGFEGVSASAVTEREPGLVSAEVTLASDRREDLAAALVQAGVGLRRMEEGEGELERIFLSLTRTHASEEARA